MKYFPFIAAIAALSLAACAKPVPPPPDYAAQYQPAVDTYIAGWNEGRFDEFDGIMASDFHRTSPGGLTAEGMDGTEKVMTDLRTAYPDAKVVLDESYFLEDVSFHLWTFTGTNTGTSADGSAATGKPVKLSGMTRIRYHDGKMAEEAVQFDVLDWQQQLGYTMTAPAATKKKK